MVNQRGCSVLTLKPLLWKFVKELPWILIQLIVERCTTTPKPVVTMKFTCQFVSVAPGGFLIYAAWARRLSGLLTFFSLPRFVTWRRIWSCSALLRTSSAWAGDNLTHGDRGFGGDRSLATMFAGSSRCVTESNQCFKNKCSSTCVCRYIYIYI